MPLKTETRQAFCQFYSTLYWRSQAGQLAWKWNKSNSDWKGRNKIISNADDTISHREDSIEFNGKILELINKFSKITKTWSHINITFLYTNNGQHENKIKKMISSIVATKRIKCLEWTKQSFKTCILKTAKRFLSKLQV